MSYTDVMHESYRQPNHKLSHRIMTYLTSRISIYCCSTALTSYPLRQIINLKSTQIKIHENTVSRTLTNPTALLFKSHGQKKSQFLNYLYNQLLDYYNHVQMIYTELTDILIFLQHNIKIILSESHTGHSGKIIGNWKIFKNPELTVVPSQDLFLSVPRLLDVHIGQVEKSDTQIKQVNLKTKSVA